MALVDIIAYVQKKKKVVSSQCPATTAVKTSVSLQLQILKCFVEKLIIFWDYYFYCICSVQRCYILFLSAFSVILYRSKRSQQQSKAFRDAKVNVLSRTKQVF